MSAIHPTGGSGGVDTRLRDREPEVHATSMTFDVADDGKKAPASACVDRGETLLEVDVFRELGHVDPHFLTTGKTQRVAGASVHRGRDTTAPYDACRQRCCQCAGTFENMTSCLSLTPFIFERCRNGPEINDIVKRKICSEFSVIGVAHSRRG
ncbi:hypothetical protein [Rhizobium sp. BE258]|jgi:hypothetical protein|uniref:hypothetical protein n=1 Tax=Rhizobium sp. BE258 TaxID=2817722 RepID=UPI002867512C|nr:hypothetical protein [Rhizobium sp. BE258]MDR7141940.1 hypothetical protein [Rhizobium sp. BE258]